MADMAVVLLLLLNVTNPCSCYGMVEPGIYGFMVNKYRLYNETKDLQDLDACGNLYKHPDSPEGFII